MDERESILIVDDDESTRSTLTLIFEKKGYETETAGTGREAIEQAQGRFFNLALLDIRLADVTGVELVAPLKEMHPDMVVIIVTAYASLETAVRALNCGASAYITKPLHMNEVLATVGEALEKQRLVMGNRRLFQQVQQELAERVRAEEKIVYQAGLLQNVTDTIFATDLTFNITSWNKAAETMYGWKADEVIGKPAGDLMVQDYLQQTRAEVAKQLRDEGHWEGEAIHKRKDGTALHVLASATLLRDSAGNVVGAVGISHDITERKRVEAEREALIVELEAKNAELERFTYTVSHDLKSPLITIRGFLGLLEQYAVKGDIEQLRTDIQYICEATDTMYHLLDDLLELSRIGRLVNPPQEVPFADLAHEALERVAGQIAERGVQVTMRADLPTVYGDRLRLVGVLQNLIENAIKFMGDQSAPQLEIGAQPGAYGPVLYVADNGIGIDPRYHEKVFGLFERLDPEVEGTGVGLALVKRIIEVHGGRIWVESAGPGRGSTFYFILAQKGE